MANNQSHEEDLNEEANAEEATTVFEGASSEDALAEDVCEEASIDVPAESSHAEEALVEEYDEERIEQQLAEEAEEAIDSLYGGETQVLAAEETEQLTEQLTERLTEPLPEEAEAYKALEQETEEADERLTQLLTPIGQSAHTVTPVVQGPTESVQTTMQRNEGRIRHKLAAALISILALFGIGLGAGMYTSHVKSQQETAALIAENERKAQEAQEAQQKADEEAEAARIQEAAHAPRTIKFIVSASEYDSRATRIPLVITGIDLDGTEVKTEGFINNEGEGVSLVPGEYMASIPASPILANGGMYRVPNTTYSFRVPNDEQDVVSVDQAIVLIPLNKAEINDDAINNAYNWAVKDAEYAGIAEANIALSRQIQKEEKERKAAEEKRKRDQEQRAPLAQSFAESFFTSVGFPDETDDSKVLVITNWNAVVSQYVASGSSAASKLSAGSGAPYSFATSVEATNISGDKVTVDVDLVSASEIKNGWTLNKSSKQIVCTFDDNNKIIDYSIS